MPGKIKEVKVNGETKGKKGKNDPFGLVSNLPVRSLERKMEGCVWESKRK